MGFKHSSRFESSQVQMIWLSITSSPPGLFQDRSYIFLPSIIPLIHKVNICEMAWSDHSLLLFVFFSPQVTACSSHWWLNESLLSDPVKCAEIKHSIAEYFQHNVMDEISPILVWTTHEVMIRGKLIQLTSRHCSSF